MRGVSAAGDKSKWGKANVEEGEGQRERCKPDMIQWAPNIFSVQRPLAWLLFKAVLAAWRLSRSSPSSTPGRGRVSLGFLYPKDTRGSLVKFCAPRSLRDLVFPSCQAQKSPIQLLLQLLQPSGVHASFRAVELKQKSKNGVCLHQFRLLLSSLFKF